MRVLLQQLHRQRALTGDHRRMIKRRHEGVALLFRQLNRFSFRLVEVSAVEISLTAKCAHRIYLDVRRSHRHHNQRFDAEPAGGERHALRVVAGRRRYHAARFLLFV